VSVGAAETDDGTGSHETILATADRAMYRDKQVRRASTADSAP